jgi:NAD(P)-dependent dehydrogenase (short-subunit alcohol dehydrogenase family)
MSDGDVAVHRDALFDLAGRVAIVVGAGAGSLGAGAAGVLSRNGAAVVVADIPARSRELDATATSLAGEWMTVLCDVTSEDSVAQLVGATTDRFGHVDILVNAAGLMLRKPVTEMSLDEWQRVMDTNLTGAWLLSRAVSPHMTERGYGRIVHFASVYAERVGPLPESAYYASKAGVANLTRAMAAEVGTFGVTVNCLAPGVFYPTGMTAPLGDDPTALQRMSERTLLKRLGEPDRDLAGPLLLLVSDAGAYITGAVVYVDGGWSAW